MSGKLYLVTGGTGFIGSALVKALIDRGDQVRVLDNNLRGSLSKLGTYVDKIDMFEADIRSKEGVRKALDGVQVVCHLAAINGTKNFYEIPDQVLSVGVEGTLNILEASRDEKIEEFYFASSSEVYQTPPTVPTDESVPMCIPEPFNPRYSYGGSKLIGELLAANFGRDHFKTTIFRPHNVYGPDMGFDHVLPEFIVRMHQLASTGSKEVHFPIQGDGSETRAFCEIRDFIRGLLIVVDQGDDQSLYHIGTNEEVSIADVAKLVAQQMGLEIVLQPGEVRAGGTKRRCPDISKVAELGYSPDYGIADGIPDTVSWYRDWAQRQI